MNLLHLFSALVLSVAPLAANATGTATPARATGAASATPYFCLPGDVNVRVVGDTASDAQCTDNDIQSAINNATGVCGNRVIITREHLYTNQHLSISNRSLTLTGVGDGVTCGEVLGGGGSACDPNVGGCPPPPSGPQVTIDGSDHDANTGNNSPFATIGISGNSHVTISYLEVTGATATGDGGGISFAGTGSLTLTQSTVDHNAAGYGGGINFNGTGDADHVANLTLGENTLVGFNTAATSGGGIRIEGNARLSAVENTTLIGYNHAPGGYGGGIEVRGPARADIGSPGYGGLPVVYANTANYGGGIAAIAGSDDYQAPTVWLFTTDPQHPVSVSDNSATAAGGGIYLKPDRRAYVADALLCAHDFRINDNLAQEGTGIYADADFDHDTYPSKSIIHLNQNQCADPPPTAVACAAGVACNEINGNAADNDTPDGAVVLVQTDGLFDANRVSLRGNSGGYVLRSVEAFSLGISNCLVAENEVSGSLIFADTGTVAVTVKDCTFAKDTILGDYRYAIKVGSPLILLRSIVYLPGDGVLYDWDNNPNGLQVAYVMANYVANLPPAAPGIAVADPQFVDADNGDFHLRTTSPALDFAPIIGGTDLDGRPRDVDLASVSNGFGPRDIGAYERQSAFACDDNADALFCDGFEPQP